MNGEKRKENNYFITLLRSNLLFEHKIRINERVFKLDDIEKWKHFALTFLEYMHYSCNYNGEDFNEIMIEIFEKINKNNRRFKNQIGNVLGNVWRKY